MANKQMFSSKVTESMAFLQMPASTQNLYFHLGMYTDDEGFVETYPVMRLTRAAEDDLKILISKGFASEITLGNLKSRNIYKVTHELEVKKNLEEIFENIEKGQNVSFRYMCKIRIGSGIA